MGVGMGMGVATVRLCGTVAGREKKDDFDVAIDVNYGVSSFIEFVFVFVWFWSWYYKNWRVPSLDNYCFFSKVKILNGSGQIVRHLYIFPKGKLLGSPHGWLTLSETYTIPHGPKQKHYEN